MPEEVPTPDQTANAAESGEKRISRVNLPKQVTARQMYEALMRAAGRVPEPPADRDETRGDSAASAD